MYIAHISDLHINIEDKAGVVNLHKIIRCINNLDVRPDFVVVSGDLSHLKDYKNYQKCFEQLNKLNVPYYVITGNHDESEQLKLALKEFYPEHPVSELDNYLQYVVDNYPVRLIALDTFKSGKGNGDLGSDRLDWLKNKLEDNPHSKPVAILLHQFTLKTELSFFDSLEEHWFNKFNEIIAQYKDTVKIVLCGHLHNSLIGNIDSVPIISAFSTNWQAYFDFKEREYLVANKLPVGFYLHRYDGKSFMSYVVAVSKEGCE